MRKLFLFFALILFLFSFVSAQVQGSGGAFFGGRSGTASYVNYGSSFNSYYGSQVATYWPVLSNRAECSDNQDILIQVSPVGCQPAVVRSDLIAEQNVPVFCQLDLLQINPIIDIKQIRNLRFNGRYPPEVAGVGFHPANAALRTTNTLLGSPLKSNIGYVVVVLKRNANETSLPKFFNFTLSASVDYYSGNSVGIGTTEMLLRENSDEEWKVAKNKQTFFGGKFSVRVKDVNTDSIKVELYSGDIKYSEIGLRKNQPQPGSVYLPGSYCQTSLQFSYSDFVSPSVIARIKVDDDVLDLYEGSRFLSDKCVVRKVSGNSNKGDVDISCGRETFKLFSSVQLLKVGDEVYAVEDGFKVNFNNKYILNAVIVNKKSGETEYNITKISDSKSQIVPIYSVRPVSQNKLIDANYGELERYINNATKYYEEVADSYGNEKNNLAEFYGEKALSAAIYLSKDKEKKNTAAKLIEKYLQLYPDGKNSVEFIGILNSLYTRDSSVAGQKVETDDGFHIIKLIEVLESEKKSSAKITWSTADKIEEKVVELGKTASLSIGNVTLLSIKDAETVNVNVDCSNSRQNNKDYKGLLSLRGSTVTACGGVVKVSNIDVQTFVKLTISPVTRSSTVGNFTVGIGIEKRAIELTPSKAKKRIENLNKTIKQWQSISNNLGNVVRGLKGACFATAGVLIVKNFITGLDGETRARRDAMSGDNGWTKICQNEVNAKKPGSSTLTECYNTHSPDIKKSVEARVKAIKKTNEVTSSIEKSSMYLNREGFFAGESFDDIEARKALIERIRGDCKDVKFNSENVEKDVVGLLPEKVDNENVKQYGYSQLRDIYYNCQTVNSADSEQGLKKAKTDLSVIGKSIEDRKKYENTQGLYNGISVYPIDDGKPHGKYSGDTVEKLKGKSITGFPAELSGNTPAQVVMGENGKSYLVTFNPDKDNKYIVDKVYSLNDKVVGSKIENWKRDVGKLPASFDLINSAKYNNQFAPGELTVRYFDTEPYKGTPAVVPFDLTRGFYAVTTQSLPILGQTKSYESNGRPSSFYVCNVMDDKYIGFYSPNYGDDECVQFNIYTGQPFTSFPGLSESDTKKLVSDAIRALEEAAQQYGKKSVKIGGNMINVGNSAALLPGSQCQTYMSAEDCKLLFNVCDPVICPVSRCNLGGTYYVSDVIQSGIIGSALLCLPNIKEGIVMPVCLTGLKAVIDGYLSILKSHQQCLQEAVDTGKYVGICDQINSVYMCEFFWRQAAPIAKAALPKLIEYMYTGGQGNVRGGGEYMTVKDSWQNMEDSASYFTQNYAANSFEAFKIRNVEEAGTEVCRAFVSVKGPKTFETLVEPDSPAQFHAWYSAIDFTDATVPATSQYKVFYHIFAGNDRGVSYSVYLKDPPADVQYSSNPVVVVANGFAAKGQYATESKDFTAPKGYKQLCVRINDKEECGFKQVSSSFAVDYVKDSILSDELTRTDITTESECVSGSVSPAALLNPNLQSVGEEALNPAIYNRGIVRICATSNPGSATDPVRFVKVGDCGSPRMGCWLDKNSVSKTIEAGNVGLKNQTLSEINAIQKSNFEESGEFKSKGDIKTKLDEIKVRIRQVTETTIGLILKDLDDLFDNAFWNEDKAEILLSKATVYENMFKNSIGGAKVSGAPAVAVTPSAGAESASGVSGERVLSFVKEPKTGRDYIWVNVGESDQKNTGIFIIGEGVFFDNVGRIGHVDDGRIIFEGKGDVDLVDDAFEINGVYELFKEQTITVDQIQTGSYNLDVGNTLSGRVEL